MTNASCCDGPARAASFVEVPLAHRPAGLAGAIRALPGTLARWRQRARQRAQLGRLDDRMLRDIGVRREQALAEARKPFWQP